MSLDPKMLAGDKGTVKEQVTAGVIHRFWSRQRVGWGAEVTLGALISGYKEGSKVKLKIFEDDGGPEEEDDPVVDLDCTLEEGFAKAEWKVEFEDPDSDEGGEYEFYFQVELKGELLSTKADCPLLFLDLLPPELSI